MQVLSTPALRTAGAVLAALLGLGVMSGCSTDEVESAARTASQNASDAALKSLRESSIVTKSQTYVQTKLDAGVSRSQLLAAVDTARKKGQTSPAAACVQKQLIHLSGVSGAVLACRVELVRELGSAALNR